MGVPEVIQVFRLWHYPQNHRRFGSPLQSSSTREKEKKGENFQKACMETLSYSHSPFIYRHLVYEIFRKTLIILSISTNIYRPYTCDPLGSYISLVYNSIDQIISYWSNFINYLYQHID